jgi:hypothetical protein
LTGSANQSISLFGQFLLLLADQFLRQFALRVDSRRAAQDAVSDERSENDGDHPDRAIGGQAAPFMFDDSQQHQ